MFEIKIQIGIVAFF